MKRKKPEPSFSCVLCGWTANRKAKLQKHICKLPAVKSSSSSDSSNSNSSNSNSNRSGHAAYFVPLDEDKQSNLETELECDEYPVDKSDSDDSDSSDNDDSDTSTLPERRSRSDWKPFITKTEFLLFIWATMYKLSEDALTNLLKVRRVTSISIASRYY